MTIGFRATFLVPALAAALLPAADASAAQASLLWDYTASGAAGFALYCGTSSGSGSYTNRIDVGNTTSYTLTGLADAATYFCSAVAYDSGRQESLYSNEVRIDTALLVTDPTPVPSPLGDTTIWRATAVPQQPGFPERQPVELGVKFRADIDGSIIAIRFFKSTSNTGIHVASLWTTNGVLLARTTFDSETASGWQQVNFSTPVPIAAGTVYVASYHTNTGFYAGDNGYFAAGVDNGPLHALQNGVDGGNGVYAYGSDIVFPTNTYKATNYWVDVVFKAK